MVELLACPECQSEEVTLITETEYFANTGDLFCHSVKPHDANSKALCFPCGWTGKHNQLLNYGKSFFGKKS